MQSSYSRAMVVLAFAAVYVIWGSTYLAIRVALETLPPFFMAGVRFLIAGSLMYAWARWRDGAPAPSVRQWRDATVIGGLLLLGGNGGVVWAEQHIPSGLAALLVATVPLFMVLLDWWWTRSARPDTGLLVGLGVGFLGVSLLVDSPEGTEGVMWTVGAVVVLFAALFWAMGSIYSRGVRDRPAPRTATGMHMLAGGALLMAVSLALGEPLTVEPAAVSGRSLAALAYLIVFGAIIGFTAYIWLLTVSTPARVATYAYVNPVVALFLGWALADEPLTAATLLGAAAVLASVVIVSVRGGLRSPRGGTSSLPAATTPGDSSSPALRASRPLPVGRAGS